MWVGILMGASASAIVIGLWWARRRLVIVDVVGGSMRPAVEHGDRVLAHRTALPRLRQGAVVVVEQPVRRDGCWQWPSTAGSLSARKWMIKRAAALPGDVVPTSVRAAAGEAVVPGDAIVVLGDNPGASTDSREMGLVPGGRVLGVAVCRVPWPRHDRMPDARSTPRWVTVPQFGTPSDGDIRVHDGLYLRYASHRYGRDDRQPERFELNGG